MKTLCFYHRGELFKINEQGHITRTDIPGFRPSGSWIFLGVSFHHWRNGIDKGLQDAFKDPPSIVSGLVWDKDHGTIRQWGGLYGGRLPRITSAWVVEE